MFHKMITGGLFPDYLAEMAPGRVNQIYSYNLRNSDDYLTVRTNSQLYFNSFLPSVVREWNALPHRGDSNEHTQYTIFNIKMKITLNYLKSAAKFAAKI